MGASALSPKLPDRAAISPPLLNACLALFLVNAAFFMVMSVSDQWIVDPQGLGIPTDFINVWSAGWLVLQGQPATAYDWDIQKQAETAVLGRDYAGNFAWHYPPPLRRGAMTLQPSTREPPRTRDRLRISAALDRDGLELNRFAVSAKH
jgi:arabinofuranan 3-O-arabinosyltransferase